MDNILLLSNRTEDTIKIAKKIRPFLQLGDIILLDGDLGTGKTFFVKAIADELGVKEKITSPTFTLAGFYKIAEGYLLHSDIYRLSDSPDFIDLGLTDYFDESIVFIEWGKKIVDEFDDFLLIKFEYVGQDLDHRKVTLSCLGPNWADRFEKLKIELSEFAK